MNELVVGIDLGTGGVRCIATNRTGAIVAQAEQPLRSVRDGLRFEQDPQEWWRAATTCLRSITADVRDRGIVAAISVAATSGTVTILDERGRTLYPALMYSDGRSSAEAEWLNRSERETHIAVPLRFNNSWGLPKLLWLIRNEPDRTRRAAFFAHAGDIITGQLCGDYGVTDWTQALKTGYDLINQRWHPGVEVALGQAAAKLPRVVPPGTIIGAITVDAAAQTGLPTSARVVAGMTDGCAAQVAGGAVEPGQWLSVLGTTLVVKGVSETLLADPLGRVYSHRHPQGYWLPGAASNTGGGALDRWRRDQLAALDREAQRRSPTSLTVYPLLGTGERFPFLRSDAHGFTLGMPRDDAESYAATLEGVAYVERLGYEVLAGLGATINGPLLTTGGATRSTVWTQIRADVLQRPLIVPAVTGADFGAAIIAASATLQPDLITATRAMVRLTEPVTPRPQLTESYAAGYARFVATCRERGYLDESG